MAGDPSQELEKRRDVPTRYKRQVWQKALENMKEILTIKTEREGLHIKNRLKKGKQMRRQQDIKNVSRNIHLIKSPAAKTAKREAEQMQVEEPESAGEELMEEN